MMATCPRCGGLTFTTTGECIKRERCGLPPVAVLSFGFSEWDGATQRPAALPPEVKAP